MPASQAKPQNRSLQSGSSGLTPLRVKDSYPPIGYLCSCFDEKFGAPRQSLLIPASWAVLKLNPEPSYAQALEELETFSHLWLIYIFHQHLHQPWHPRVQPPRVHTKSVGVFASRSPHRPNPIGISAVKLERIDRAPKDGIEIHLSGVDVLNGTPVLDIKPYLPYADSIPQASSGWAREEIERYPVEFSPQSLARLSQTDSRLKELVAQMASLDPRPISQRVALPLTAPENEGAIFRFRLQGFDVEWQIRGRGVYVVDLYPLS